MSPAQLESDPQNEIKEVYVKMEGYLGTDLSSIGDGKKGRVLAYIFFALLPCLLLVPFMMSRDFIPQDGF